MGLSRSAQGILLASYWFRKSCVPSEGSERVSSGLWLEMLGHLPRLETWKHMVSGCYTCHMTTRGTKTRGDGERRAKEKAEVGDHV